MHNAAAGNPRPVEAAFEPHAGLDLGRAPGSQPLVQFFTIALGGKTRDKWKLN
jgi:hypothetical protein